MNDSDCKAGDRCSFCDGGYCCIGDQPESSNLPTGNCPINAMTDKNKYFCVQEYEPPPTKALSL